MPLHVIHSFYHFQDGHLHHALFGIRRLVLDHLDSHNLLRFDVFALDHLTKGACTQYIQNHIPTYIASLNTSAVIVIIILNLLVSLSTTQDIIDIQDIIVVFIVVSIIGSRFARFGKHATWIMT